MLHLFRSIGMAVMAVMAFQIAAADSNPARQASEIEPTETQRGETANRGPQHYGTKEESADMKKAEKTEKSEPAEKKEEAKDEKKEEKHKEKKEKKQKKDKEKKEEAKPEESGADKDKTGEAKCATCGKTPCACANTTGACATCLEATIPAAQKSGLAKADFDRKMRTAIMKLSTSGWREAQIELIDGGKGAVPYLIDAMAVNEEEGAKAPAYNLGGHTKADAGRAPRQRSVAEVAAELLTNMVTNHSNFKGELPSVDQKAWQEWWIANGETVTFSK